MLFLLYIRGVHLWTYTLRSNGGNLLIGQSILRRRETMLFVVSRVAKRNLHEIYVLDSGNLVKYMKFPDHEILVQKVILASNSVS